MTRRPFKLGLTGSIGMGKTTTARMFADAGVPVWDADAAVHRLYAPGGAGIAAVATLAPQATGPEGVDRGALKAWLAEDPGRLARLEAAVHPLVAQDRAAFVAAHSDAPVLLFDIPLLYETEAEAWLDAVAVVSATAEAQAARVLARPGMTRAQLDLILARQMPDAEKCRRADYVIPTHDMDGARAAVRDILDGIHRGPEHA